MYENMNSVLSPLRVPTFVQPSHPHHRVPSSPVRSSIYSFRPATQMATNAAYYSRGARANARERSHTDSSTTSRDDNQRSELVAQSAAEQHDTDSHAVLTPPTQRSMARRAAAASSARTSMQSQPQPQPQSHHQQQQQQPQQQPSRRSVPKQTDTVEWRIAVDPKTKRPYYYHPITRETTWKKPAALVEKEKRERAQFFAAMENNIRSKLRDGNWFRNSLMGVEPEPEALHDSDDSDDGLSSSTTSSRSSWSSTTAASVACTSHVTLADASKRLQSQSVPSTPAVGTSNQVTNDSSDDDAALLAAASKPPTLFRTLSSYETPVVGSTKKLANGRVIAIPSPIQERVRLAVMDDVSSAAAPRLSDVESYARRSQQQQFPTAAALRRTPLRRRSNSTSTIFVRMGTMNAPDQDTTIQCVATVLRAHLMEAQASPIEMDARFDRFRNRRDERANAMPSLKEIGAFIKHVFSRAQMESECIIMSLIYVERLLKATMGSLQLRPGNWRSILFCSMVMASKVWDDLSMCNADFSKIWPELSLREINDLELTYLSAVEYNVRVSAVSYAKYYFHLRSMCASMGMLAAFDESAPLNLEGARKMQVLSEDYQERSKLMPAPRRRSVTITSTAAAASSSSVASASSAMPSATTSPAASLEQLVQMQVRGAGGVSLSSMHRLSSRR
ncbi:hypothetical protein ATCC90586_009035 [Pythium insidiosum]|nr:hypothetical protein ATCC90586_009035 [Pythium insidiosum]